MLFLYTTCTLVGAVVFLKYILWSRKYYQSIPARKHRFFNILGDITDFNLKKDLSFQICDIVGKILNSSPKEPLVCAWISLFPLVLVAKSDAVREVLKTNKIVDKSYHYNWIKEAFGAGLITSPGEKWKPRRKLFNPCFHSNVLRNYLDTFNKMSLNLVKVLHKETQADSIEIVDPLTFCAFDTVCETVFGTRIDVSDNEKKRISKCLKRCESIFMTRVYSLWLWPDFIYQKTKIGKEGIMQTDIVNEFVRKLIRVTKERYLSGERAIYSDKHRGLIDVLLEKHLDTQEFSEEDIIEEAVTFMLAGHDTIAMAAMWTVYLIGHHPEVQAKLHEEVDRVFGGDKERAVTEEDLRDLQYMDCVLKECQRMYPPVPLIGRTFKEETKICGHTMPKGGNCAILIYFLHRDKDVFPDPEKFDPERFSPENRVKIPEFAYIPFSAGPRNCIGYKFAEIEMGIMMSSIFRNFTVETLNKVQPRAGVSLHASEPIRIKIRPRDIHKT